MKQIYILKKDKGTAGLTILLSLIVMLFVIGLIVMIFSLMSTALQQSSYTVTSTTAVNESVATPTSAVGSHFSAVNLRSGACGAVTSISNGTGGSAIAVGNFTQGGTGNCVIVNKTSMVTYGDTLLVSYHYTYSADNSATTTINQTGNAVAGVVTYFPLFITIGAMVVLILLTVIIITAIRSSGLVGGEAGQQNVGTA